MQNMSYLCNKSMIIHNRIKDFVVSTEDLNMMFNCGVYKIHHENDPNKFYVGSASRIGSRDHTSGIYRRWLCHLYNLRKNKHHSKYLQNIVNKYGIEGLRFSILEICSSKDCIKTEQKYLDLLKPTYNSCKIAGNCLGFKHSPKTIALWKSQRTGRKRAPFSHETLQLMSFLAKNRDMSHLRTKEVTEKRSKKMKGRALSQEVYDSIKRKIYQFSKEGILLNTYNSGTDAAKALSIDRASINNCALGNRDTAGGFIWSFNSIITPYFKRRIDQYTLDGVFIKSYSNLEQVRLSLNKTSSTAIRNCFSGIQKQAYGYIWKDNKST